MVLWNPHVRHFITAVFVFVKHVGFIRLFFFDDKSPLDDGLQSTE